MSREKRPGQSGFVLVIVLLVTALLVTVAVEFAHRVYVGVTGLHNLQVMERLSLETDSLVESSSGMLQSALQQGIINAGGPGMQFALENGVTLDFNAGDENAKFNVNSVVTQSGDINQDGYESFQRLLKAIGLDKSIADKLVNWVKAKRAMATSAGNTSNTGNSSGLDSIAEFRLFVDTASYDKLRDYITVFGNGLININTASVPVLMSLADSSGTAVTQEQAQNIVTYRSVQGNYGSIGELQNTAGCESLPNALAGKITTSSSAMDLNARAEQEGIKRITEAVVDQSGNVLYWREF